MAKATRYINPYHLTGKPGIISGFNQVGKFINNILIPYYFLFLRKLFL